MCVFELGKGAEFMIKIPMLEMGNGKWEMGGGEWGIGNRSELSEKNPVGCIRVAECLAFLTGNSSLTHQT